MFLAITLYCKGQEKIVLATGDTIVGRIIKVDIDHSRILKSDGTSLLILSNMIKKEEEEKSSIQVTNRIILGVHGAPVGAIRYGAREQRKLDGVKFKPVLGFIAGLEMQYAIRPKTIFHIEINYERKGGAQDDYIWGQNVPSTARTIVKEYDDYLTVPVMVKFILSNKKTKFFINTGVYAGYFVNVQWELMESEYNGHLEGRYKPNSNYLNLVDVGLITGLGWNFPIKEHFQFSTEIRNNLGLAGSGKGEIFSNSNIKHESLALLFGMAYKLK